MKHIFLVFFITVLTNCIGQYSFRSTSIKGQAMGNASVLNTDMFSALDNVSSLALVDSVIVGLNFQNSYFLRELSRVSIGGIFSGKRNSFGFQYQKFGNTSYSENKCGIVYGKKLYESLYFGTKINYHFIQQNFYGNASLLDFELGFRTKINHKIEFATHIFNPLKFSLENEQGEVIQPNSGLRAGILIKEKQVDISAEVEGSTQSSILLKTGIDWAINKVLNLQLGSTFPKYTVSAGLELKLNKTTLNTFYSYHTLLQHSSGLGLHYEF